MAEQRWYIKVTLPSGHAYWVHENGPMTEAHMEFQYAEAYPANILEFKHQQILERIPFGCSLRFVPCDADEFALPENLRRVINA